MDSQTRMKMEMLERTVNGYKEMCANLEREMVAAKAMPDLSKCFGPILFLDLLSPKLLLKLIFLNR